MVELLAGVRAAATVDTGSRQGAADLLVLLDHANLHAGRQLFVASRGRWRYRVTDDAATAQAPLQSLASRVTAAVASGEPVDFEAWPGRIDRVALITCDRPATLARTLDAYLANLYRFQRHHVEIMVYDGSGPRHRARVRRVVQARQAGGARVGYCGPEEKHSLLTGLRQDLPGVPPDVLDALLGRLDRDGRWCGSGAEQRNWATRLGASGRVVVADDDARPEVLDVPLARLRVAAREAVQAPGWRPGLRMWPGELLGDALIGVGGGLVAWPTDLIGRLEEAGQGLASAAYTGHPDLRTALWLERFFELSDQSVDVLGPGAPLRPVRRDPPPQRRRKFRGATFVTGGSGDGVVFAVRRDRNEDFSLALSQQLATGGRLNPGELATAHIYHQRGSRFTGPFAAHRQEHEGNLVNRLVAGDIAETTIEVAGAELFDEGLAYRDRARAHLAALGALHSGGKRASGWSTDRTAVRAALLRSGARLLRAGRTPSAAALRECAQVLVPAGFLTTVDPVRMRQQVAALPATGRAAAAAELDREVTFWQGPGRLGVRQWLPAGGAAARIASKVAQTKRLIEEIETELDLTSGDAGDARKRFTARVRERVLADVRLSRRARGHVPAVRAWLARAPGIRTPRQRRVPLSRAA